MKKWVTLVRPLALSSCLLAMFCLAGPAMAKETSLFSPIIDVDTERGYIFVSGGSGIVIVRASKAAKPHLGKLPVGGMIDIVIEQEPGQKAALLKSWKVVAGESDCKVFDGKVCK